jgi:hypothetical protein
MSLSPIGYEQRSVETKEEHSSLRRDGNLCPARQVGGATPILERDCSLA